MDNRLDAETIEDVTVQQYFDRSTPFALLSALVVAAAIVLWLSTSTRLVQADRQLLTLAIVWLVIPTALIIICSAFVHPIYTPRYLCFTAPAVALVLGVCIGALALSLDPWMGDFEWSSARFGAVSRAVDVAAHV